MHKMKKQFSIAVIAILLLASCSTNNNTSNAGQVATSGSWRITLFTDSGNDETSDFTGYSFTFSTSGSVTAVKNAVSQTGTWSINTSSNKFNIDLGAKVDTNKPLGELTDDWKIISASETVIQLEDDNSASNERVTFTKN
jgi:hypothetical protein